MQESQYRVERYETDPVVGLQETQVIRRQEEGLTNRSVSSATKTTSDIIKENVFTYFNGIFLL